MDLSEHSHRDHDTIIRDLRFALESSAILDLKSYIDQHLEILHNNKPLLKKIISTVSDHRTSLAKEQQEKMHNLAFRERVRAALQADSAFLRTDQEDNQRRSIDVDIQIANLEELRRNYVPGGMYRKRV